MRALVITLVLACCATAQAQEFELFDPNDFLDPRERGAVFTRDGFAVVEPGDAFTLVRAYGGGINDYQWRDTPTDADLSFLHFTTNAYRGNKQLNLKLTLLNGESETRVPGYRGTIQYGQYFVTEQRDAQGRDSMREEHDLRVSGRWLVTLSAEENTLHPDIAPGTTPPPLDGAPQNAATPRASRLLYAFGFESDGYIRYRRASVVGSLVWMRRKVAEHQVVDRVTYIYRLGERPVRNVRLNASFGVGGERNDGWHWGATRALLVATYDLRALKSSLNLAYGPTYVPGARLRKVHHEFAIYLDSTILARLTPALRH